MILRLHAPATPFGTKELCYLIRPFFGRTPCRLISSIVSKTATDTLTILSIFDKIVKKL